MKMCDDKRFSKPSAYRYGARLYLARKIAVKGNCRGYLATPWDASFTFINCMPTINKDRSHRSHNNPMVLQTAPKNGIKIEV
jgi:hypothetical protein